MTGSSSNSGAYAHGIRTYALVRSVHHDQNPQTQGVCKTGRPVIPSKVRMKTEGGRTDLEKDRLLTPTSQVSGWCIQGLKAAALTGIPIEGLG